MSSKIFKNNQVTYGAPFQVRIPVALQNIKQREEGQGIFIVPDEPDMSIKPEDILERAQQEAVMITKEAEYEARKIIGDAYTEAKEKAVVMEEEAWQKGYEEGLAAAKEQYEATISEAEEIRAGAVMERNEMMASLETEVINLVIDISKKVIGSEIAVNKENMIYLVKQAIDNCSNKIGIILKVSAEDYNFLDENRDKLEAVINCSNEVELKKELTLKPGSCILETPLGIVDAGVQTKLRKIEEAFRELIICK